MSSDYSILFMTYLCHVYECVYLLVASDGSQYSGPPDGMFRKPSKGQSLISYLSEQDFGSCADLEKVKYWTSVMQEINNRADWWKK